MHESDGVQIFSVEEIPRNDGQQPAHIVKKGVALYRNIKAEYNEGVVTVSLYEPIIEGTEYQGAPIQENISVDIYIDGEYASTETIINGKITVILDLLAGTHEIEARAALCTPVKIEVVV